MRSQASWDLLKGKLGVVACEKVGLTWGLETEQGEVCGWVVGLIESVIAIETLVLCNWDIFFTCLYRCVCVFFFSQLMFGVCMAFIRGESEGNGRWWKRDLGREVCDLGN